MIVGFNLVLCGVICIALEFGGAPFLVWLVLALTIAAGNLLGWLLIREDLRDLRERERYLR